MAVDYDLFSLQFKKSREFPFRTCIEEFLMLHAREARRAEGA
jgi:hypothetical protein